MLYDLYICFNSKWSDIAHMFGPLEGRRHDAIMLSVSGLPNKLRSFNRPDGHPYVLYGDPAFGVMRNILSPYRSSNLTPTRQEFNENMSAVRVMVEWAFGKFYNTSRIWILTSTIW